MVAISRTAWIWAVGALVAVGVMAPIAAIMQVGPGGQAPPPISGAASPAVSPTGSASGSPTASPTASRTGGTTASPTTSPAGPRWQPKVGTRWQWQLDAPVDLRVDVPIYDIDGFENSASVVRALHAKNRRVICYVEVGAAENFRPDYASFPKSVLGTANGWSGERWVDIRQLNVLTPILAKRFDMCRSKGFDAVEPDLMDHYANRTGFKITAADQLKFNRLVARLAHERGLAVGLKNDPDQVRELVSDFDFAVVEECAQYDECDAYTPFIKAGKPVLHVEYELTNVQFCAEARALGFSSMRKNLSLDAARWPC